jgi:hypothetical protein
MTRAVHAYPLGLLALILTALAFLIRPWLGVVAALALLVPATAVVRARTRLGEVASRAATPFLWAGPGIVAFPLALGLLLHGPSSELGSNAFGDLVFYVARLQSATESVLPYRDLLVEGERAGYLQSGTSFLGASLAGIPGFDAFLFHTTTLPAALLTSLCIGLSIIGRGLETERLQTRTWGLVALALLTTSIAAYPTWIPESAPVALALPLAFSVFGLWREPVSAGLFFAVALALGANFLLTKVLAVIPLCTLLAFAVFRHVRVRVTRRHVLSALAVAVPVTVLTVIFVLRAPTEPAQSVHLKFLPADAARGLREQLTTRDTQAAAPAFLVVGHALLLVALFRARSYAFLITLAVSVAANWLIGGHTVDIAPGAAVLLAAFHLWTRPDLLQPQRFLVLAAGISLALSTWFRDPLGVQAGFVLAVLLAGVLLTVFLSAGSDRASLLRPAYALICVAVTAAVLFGLSGRPFLGLVALALLAAPIAAGAYLRDTRGRVAVSAAGLIFLASAGLAGRAAARDELELSDQRTTLSREHYEVWRRVAKLVPRRGLVFTTLTGPEKQSDQGWNYYPGVSARQLYIGGWLYSSISRDRAERDERLQLNRRVLSGSLAPSRLDLNRRYGSYYSVMRAREARPSSFTLLYANRLFALYRIGTG